MKIHFYGAAQTVTGSKHLITTQEGTRILLDCGMYQGKALHKNENLNNEWGFDPASIDILILSHAHIDHSGLIPKFVNEGFSGPIYCTPATQDLCELMLMDSAHIQESDIRFVNKRRIAQGKEPYEPLYDVHDVKSALKLFRPVAYHEPKQISSEVSFMFTEAGHILGSAAVHLTITEREKTTRLTFTGDIGRPEDAILRGPESFPQADLIICESTYGNRLHSKGADMEKELYDIIHDTCVKAKGKLIIPAFSLDRTQEVVYALDRLKEKDMLPPIKVYVDSPLSVKTTALMRRHSDLFNDNIKAHMNQTDGEPFIFRDIYYISEVEDSKKLNDRKDPCIIISASGMAEAGRIKHHIRNNIGDPRNTLLFVGYCTPESLGGKLRGGAETVKIFGETHEVRARVAILDAYSAHADYQEIIQYLACQNTQAVRHLFLVHGEPEAMEHMKDTLLETGYRHVHMPERGEVFNW